MNYEQQQQEQANKFYHQFRLLEQEIDRSQKQEFELRNFSLIMVAILFLLSVQIASPFLG